MGRGSSDLLPWRTKMFVPVALIACPPKRLERAKQAVKEVPWFLEDIGNPQSFEFSPMVKKPGNHTPITVKKVGEKYILIDGAMRYAACLTLGLHDINIEVV